MAEEHTTGVQDKGTTNVELVRGTRLSGIWRDKGASVEVPTWLALAMERTGLVEGKPSGIELGRKDDEQPGDDEEHIESPLDSYSDDSSSSEGSTQESGATQEEEAAAPTATRRGSRRGRQEGSQA